MSSYIGFRFTSPCSDLNRVGDPFSGTLCYARLSGSLPLMNSCVIVSAWIWMSPRSRCTYYAPRSGAHSNHAVSKDDVSKDIEPLELGFDEPFAKLELHDRLLPKRGIVLRFLTSSSTTSPLSRVAL